MPIIRDQWANELDSIVSLKVFEGARNRARTLGLRKLFNNQGSTQGTENAISKGVVGPDAWDNYNRSGTVSEADFDKGYLKTYTHVQYPLDVGIDRELADDSRWREIGDIAASIGDSAMVKREFSRASIWNNAFDVNFPGGDAVELCDAAHPYSSAKSGSTQSNTGTLALTAENVGSTQTSMGAFWTMPDRRWGAWEHCCWCLRRWRAPRESLRFRRLTRTAPTTRPTRNTGSVG